MAGRVGSEGWVQVCCMAVRVFELIRDIPGILTGEDIVHTWGYEMKLSTALSRMLHHGIPCLFLSFPPRYQVKPIWPTWWPSSAN